MNSAFDVFRMMATTAKAFSNFASTDPLQGGAAPTDNAQRLAQLYGTFVNSGYRYLARWAEISVKRYADFAQTLASINATPKGSEPQMNAMMDSLRGYLREMAELPLEESKRLQAEIEAIMEPAASVSGAAAKESGKRRARAKK
jgi:hypothetical protein